ncbi:MAG: hypothetical protein IPK69_02725 [Phycisphaerales bacterium]|nr:MAG: hypothetical protein IPK69_02725 [Phycisphaerales bacterium]
MRADYLTYKRAANVSVMGLVLHVVMGGAMLIYARLSADHAAMTLALYMLLGAVGWLALTILYDQHRRERIESIEADALAAAEESSTIFGGASEFRVAQKRLKSLYKVFSPTISVVIGVALLGVAWWRLSSLGVFSETGTITFTTSRHKEWGLGLGLAVSGIGFVFARYASGMAKQEFWANLRAGAAFTAGASVLALVLAISQFIDLITSTEDAWLKIVVVGFAVVVGILGIEVFLNVLLDVYRPRKVGDVAMPAFGSRVLGFVAAPDRIAQSISDAINYQLGFDVTSGWFYQLLVKSLAPLVVVGLLTMWLLSSLVVIQPHQRATILRFGRVVQENVTPGLHVKMPWPIDRVYVPEFFEKSSSSDAMLLRDRTVTGIRQTQLGSDPPANKGEPILWTNDHLGVEVLQIVRSSGEVTFGRDGMAGMSLVSVEIPLKYVVENVSLFDELAPPEQREQLLRYVAQREVLQYLHTATLDEVLGDGRATISNELKSRISAAFDQLNPDSTGKPRGAGVKVVMCSITGVHPPKQSDVAASFEKVVEADQKTQALLTTARADHVKELTDAAGSVEQAESIVKIADQLKGLRSSASADKPNARTMELESEMNRLLDAAGGNAAVTIAEAKATRWTRYMDLRGRAERYAGQLLAYNASPTVFRASMYADTLRDSLKNVRLYIVDDRVSDLRIDVGLEDIDTGAEIFKPKKE